MKHISIFVTLSLFAAIVSGCNRGGIPIETVQGLVTLDGAPAAGVTISFITKDGATRSATGLTNEKGEFEMLTGGANRNGAMAGEYSVLFSKVMLVGPDGKELPPFKYNADGSPPPMVVPTEKHLIPKKYADRSKPLFDAVVEKGKKNKYTFKLESK